MGTQADGFKLLLKDVVTVAKTLAIRHGGPALVQPKLSQAAETRETVARFHPPRLEVRVADRIRETADSHTLRIQPTSGKVFPFCGGQYVNVSLEIDGTRTSRAYSLSSWSVDRSHLDITIKQQPGGYVSSYLAERAQLGERLSVSGPAGEFFYSALRDSNDLVLLAAGSGVTPFMALMDEARHRDLPVKILLLYGSRSEEDILFRSRLDELQRQWPRLQVVHTLSQPSAQWQGERGRVGAELLERHVPRDHWNRKTFFLCGPHALYGTLLCALGERGVPRHRIRYESFGSPEDVTEQERWPEHVAREARFTVTLPGRAVPIPVRANEPLLNSLERAGEVRHALCRTDVCDTCKVRLVDGDVFVPNDQSRLAPARPGETIRPCMAYPVSDLVLDE